MALWEVPLSHRPMGPWEFFLWEGREAKGLDIEGNDDKTSWQPNKRRTTLG